MDAPLRLALYTNWSTQQVTSWLSGVCEVSQPYLQNLEVLGVTGKWLHSVTADDLYHLGITKIGHVMTILNKIRQLQNNYFLFDNETFQFVLFNVSRCCTTVIAAVNSFISLSERQYYHSCGIDSLYPGVLEDIQESGLYVLGCIFNLTAAVKKAALWLERSPFTNLSEINRRRPFLLSNLIQVINAAQKTISTSSRDHYKDILPLLTGVNKDMQELLRDGSESIMFTLCAVDLVHIGKAESAEFGINLHSTPDNIHVIVSVQPESPAYCSGKVNRGDEIVEVNDQVVLGWPHRNVVDLIHLHSRHLTLRLRKRPVQTTDFTGFPGGGGRRQRILAPGLSPSGDRPSTRSGYLLTRTSRRKRLPPGGSSGTSNNRIANSKVDSAVPTTLAASAPALVSNPFSNTEAVITNCTMTSNNSETDEPAMLSTILSPIYSPSSSSSLSRSSSFTAVSNQGSPSSCSRGELVVYSAGESATETAPSAREPVEKKSPDDNNCRMLCNTSNTPLSKARAQSTTTVVVTSIGEPLSTTASRGSSQLSVADDPAEPPVTRPTAFPAIPTGTGTSTQPTFTTHQSVQNRSFISNLWHTHRRTASGGPVIITCPPARNDGRRASALGSVNSLTSLMSPPARGQVKCQAVDRRQRTQVHRSSLEEVSSPRRAFFWKRENPTTLEPDCSSRPNFEGWLWFKKPNSFTGRYLKRWCVVIQSVLYYYRSQRDEVPEGLVSILGSVISIKSDSKHHRFAFVISTDSSRFVFACETDADRLKWTTMLNVLTTPHSSTDISRAQQLLADAEPLATSRLHSSVSGYPFQQHGSSDYTPGVLEAASTRSMQASEEPCTTSTWAVSLPPSSAITTAISSGCRTVPHQLPPRLPIGPGYGSTAARGQNRRQQPSVTAAGQTQHQQRGTDAQTSVSLDKWTTLGTGMGAPVFNNFTVGRPASTSPLLKRHFMQDTDLTEESH